LTKRSNNNDNSLFAGGILNLSTAAVIGLSIAGIGIAYFRSKSRGHKKNDTMEFRLPSIEDDQRAIMNDVEYHAYQVRPGGQLSTNSMRNNMAHSISNMYDEIRQRRNKTLININELNEASRQGQLSRQAAQQGVANQIVQYRSYIGTKYKDVFGKLGVPVI
jgi:hypothetical protein